MDVHTVPGNPSVTDRFGTYFVPTLPIEQLFTVKDLAACWAVCTATIYSLAKRRKLESLRIGNSIRFMETTIAAYEQTRIGAKPSAIRYETGTLSTNARLFRPGEPFEFLSQKVRLAAESLRNPWKPS